VKGCVNNLLLNVPKVGNAISGETAELPDLAIKRGIMVHFEVAYVVLHQIVNKPEFLTIYTYFLN
jgi:hypothetical protein